MLCYSASDDVQWRCCQLDDEICFETEYYNLKHVLVYWWQFQLTVIAEITNLKPMALVIMPYGAWLTAMASQQTLSNACWSIHDVTSIWWSSDPHFNNHKNYTLSARFCSLYVSELATILDTWRSHAQPNEFTQLFELNFFYPAVVGLEPRSFSSCRRCCGAQSRLHIQCRAYRWTKVPGLLALIVQAWPLQSASDLAIHWQDTCAELLYYWVHSSTLKYSARFSPVSSQGYGVWPLAQRLQLFPGCPIYQTVVVCCHDDWWRHFCHWSNGHMLDKASVVDRQTKYRKLCRCLISCRCRTSLNCAAPRRPIAIFVNMFIIDSNNVSSYIGPVSNSPVVSKSCSGQFCSSAGRLIFLNSVIHFHSCGQLNYSMHFKTCMRPWCSDYVINEFLFVVFSKNATFIVNISRVACWSNTCCHFNWTQSNKSKQQISPAPTPTITFVMPTTTKERAYALTMYKTNLIICFQIF